MSHQSIINLLTVMANTTKSRTTSTNGRFDVMQAMTDKIIAAMENGKIPWKKPWNIAGTLPANYQTKRPYSGFNLLLLSLSPYNTPYFMTYGQAQKMGGNVKKGEKGTQITFWKVGKYEDKKTGEEKKSFLLRYYTVFNIEQIEGIDFDIPQIELSENERIQKAESILSAMPNPPQYEEILSGQAYYSPMADKIVMPKIEQFESSEFYYSVRIHETVHSTGHQSRLNREGITALGKFGDTNYSFEELVAELGSAFICQLTGISNDQTFRNSAAYIQSWLRKFRNDPKMLYNAAKEAQKAVEYITGNIQDSEPSEDGE